MKPLPDTVVGLHQELRRRMDLACTTGEPYDDADYAALAMSDMAIIAAGNQRTRPHGKAINISEDADRDQWARERSQHINRLLSDPDCGILPGPAPEHGVLKTFDDTPTRPTRWYHRLWAYFVGDDISY